VADRGNLSLATSPVSSGAGLRIEAGSPFRRRKAERGASYSQASLPSARSTREGHTVTERLWLPALKWNQIFANPAVTLYSSALFLMSAIPAWSQQTDDSHLKRLKGIAILVTIRTENSYAQQLSGPEKAEIQTNEEAIRTSIELKSREAGLRVYSRPSCRLDNLGACFEVPTLVAEVTSNHSAVGYCVRLFEPVSPIRSPAVKVYGVTWNRDAVGIGMTAREVRDRIADQVDQFLNSWLAANPKQR